MKRQIWTLLTIRAIRAFLLVMPVITLYWLDVGLSIQDIFILQVIFSVAIVVLEIPSGYFADCFSRKQSLVLGMIFGTLGYIGYALATDFLFFAFAEILLALSISFISGADSAFLYDTLKQHKATEQHIKYEGRIISLARISEAAAALIGGLLAVWIGLKGVFVVQAIVMALSIPLALSLVEPIIESAGKAKKDLRGALRYAFKENKIIFHINIFTGLIFMSGLLLVWLSQPYWQEIGIPLAWFGFIWAGMNLVTSVGALVAYKIQAYLGFVKLFAIFALVPILILLLLSVGIGWFAIVVMAGMWFLRGLFQPIMLDYLNREIPSSIRATVISLNSLYTRLFFSILSPFIGWVADVWSIETAFFASAMTAGILIMISGAFLIIKIRTLVA
jgi:MFS family permease